MNTVSQTGKSIAIMSLVIGFALALLLCSVTTAQTQIGPNPNPDGNTITIGLDMMNDEDFVNNGTIETLEGTRWEFINNSGAVIDNAGTINTHPPNVAIFETAWFHNYGIINNLADGIVNSDHSFSSVGSGIMNNYGTINGNVGVYDNSVLNNYNEVNNSYSLIAIDESTINNDGVINDPYFFDVAGESTINNYGVINNPEMTYLRDYGTINNHGVINDISLFFSYDSSIVNNYGTFNNTGSFLNYSNGYGVFLYGFENHETTVNDGTFENRGGVENTGTFENNGIINNWDHAIVNRDSGIFVNNGTFYDLGGSFNNWGTYQGTGTYVGTLNTGAGTVAPSNSAGTMYVEGDYVLDKFSIWTGVGNEFDDFPGTLQIEIGGFDPGEHDFLDITGTAFLNTAGFINLSFIDGYDIASDIGPGETKTVEFLKAGSIDSFDSTVVYDFLGTPAGFVYDVYQQGNSLVFEATNTGVVYYSVVRDSACTVKFEDAVDYEGYEDSLGEDGAVETEFFNVSVENACDSVNVFIKAGKNKSGATITGESGPEMVGDFLLDWTRTGEDGAYTYNFAVTSDDNRKTKALGYIMFDFCMDPACPDTEVISPAEGQYPATRESD